MDQACSPGRAGGEARKAAPDGIASTLSQRRLVGLTGEDRLLYPERKVVLRSAYDPAVPGARGIALFDPGPPGRPGPAQGPVPSPEPAVGDLAAAACRATWI